MAGRISETGHMRLPQGENLAAYIFMKLCENKKYDAVSDLRHDAANQDGCFLLIHSDPQNDNTICDRYRFNRIHKFDRWWYPFRR
jgi:hypothetical protein